jgi:fatty acid desaturase
MTTLTTPSLGEAIEFYTPGNQAIPLTRQEIQELSRIRHGRVIRDILWTWAQILIAIQLAIWLNSWIVVVLAFFYIGCMQNALISWTHEASHYNLTRNKRLNDWVTDLFISGPAGVSVNGYRWHHVMHHRYLGDPDKEIALEMWLCLRGGFLFGEIVRYLVGGYGLRVILRYFNKGVDNIKKDNPPPPRTPASFIGFLVANGLLFALCALQGHWVLFFILWVAPLFTVALLLSNFRTIVEHQPSADVCETGEIPLPPISRVMKTTPIEAYLVAPIGFYYHYEHHLFPGIPYHRLVEARRLLESRGHFDKPGIVWGEGYIKTIWSLAMKPGYGLRLLNPLHDFGLEDHDHEPHLSAVESPE